MIVWVDDRLFAGPERHLDRLALLRNIAWRRHTLIVSEHPNDRRGFRRHPFFDAWRATLPIPLQTEIGILQEQLHWISPNAVTRGTTRLLVAENAPEPPAHGCHVTLKEAVRAVSEPLHILVENQISDAAFLRRVMPPAWREKLEKWERGGEIRYGNGGGITVMANLVDYHKLDDNAKLMFGLPAAVWRLLHFIIYDHDGNFANLPGEGARKLEKSCENAAMSTRSHRLERRDQEHYLPHEALREIVELRTPPKDKKNMLEKLGAHMQNNDRYFAKLPACGEGSFFKNGFLYTDIAWSDDWFEQDGAWPEMTRLAENIAAAL